MECEAGKVALHPEVEGAILFGDVVGENLTRTVEKGDHHPFDRLSVLLVDYLAADHRLGVHPAGCNQQEQEYVSESNHAFLLTVLCLSSRCFT